MNEYGQKVFEVLVRMGVKKILVHVPPLHFSDLVAVSLLHLLGEETMPGAHAAGLVYADKGDPQLLSHDALYWAEQGVLCLGVVGGPFDEHANRQEGPKPDCEAVLVAKALGLVGIEPKLDQFLRHVERTDRGEWGPFELATGLMAFQESPVEGTTEFVRDELRRRVELCLAVVEAAVARHLEPVTAGKPIFEATAAAGGVYEVTRRGFRTPLKFCVATTSAADGEAFTRYARSPDGGQCHVVINQKGGGGVTVFFSRWLFETIRGVSPADLARAIRAEELTLRGVKVTPQLWGRLNQVGVVEGVPEWFLHESGTMLLNRSRTTNTTPLTRIPPQRIAHLIGLLLCDKLPLDEEGGRSCVRERRCFQEQCPYFQYGLPRCMGYRLHLAEQQRQASRRGRRGRNHYRNRQAQRR